MLWSSSSPFGFHFTCSHSNPCPTIDRKDRWLLQGFQEGGSPPQPFPLFTARSNRLLGLLSLRVRGRDPRRAVPAWIAVGGPKPAHRGRAPASPNPRGIPQLQPHGQGLPQGFTLAGKVNSWIRVTRRAADSPTRRDHPYAEDARKEFRPLRAEALSSRRLL